MDLEIAFVADNDTNNQDGTEISYQVTIRKLGYLTGYYYYLLKRDNTYSYQKIVDSTKRLIARLHENKIQEAGQIEEKKYDPECYSLQIRISTPALSENDPKYYVNEYSILLLSKETQNENELKVIGGIEMVFLDGDLAEKNGFVTFGEVCSLDLETLCCYETITFDPARNQTYSRKFLHRVDINKPESESMQFIYTNGLAMSFFREYPNQRESKSILLIKRFGLISGYSYETIGAPLLKAVLQKYQGNAGFVIASLDPYIIEGFDGEQNRINWDLEDYPNNILLELAGREKYYRSYFKFAKLEEENYMIRRGTRPYPKIE